MKFLEALQSMIQDNNLMFSYEMETFPGAYIIKIINSDFYFTTFSFDEQKYRTDWMKINSYDRTHRTELVEDWKLWECPLLKKSDNKINGLFDKGSNCLFLNSFGDFLDVSSNLSGSGISKDNLMHWRKALCTFMQLKMHPIVVKSGGTTTQYVIEFYGNRIRVEMFCINIWRTPTISPHFISHDEATLAILDIGESNIIHMFKTFAGIYE